MSFSNLIGERHAPAAFRLLAAAVLAFASTLAYGVDADERTVTGKWRVTAAVDGADIASLDEREARSMVNKIMVIGPDNVQFGTHACGPSTFEAESVEPRLFLRRQFHASAGNLGLPNPVTAVKLNCTTVFIKNTDTLLIFWDGWFFNAVRMKP
ncbi:hypothetical protein [Pseudoduganella albidiflava]|uniref:DUF3617 family protein n=1 Tax=Pseudoduganella albidiflava TaxID=321983 RepID=A0A411WTU3_9BURK|nr:hypothetical protein [Pseudoduganella albidiflava]QBI00039.1 hypothetical protein EYF70_03645 [Pseudoduganella albidiflava]GGY63443.1 hypothetical protein GCM10007387_52420 [Pseudoduganella albidiflava]